VTSRCLCLKRLADHAGRLIVGELLSLDDKPVGTAVAKQVPLARLPLIHRIWTRINQK
jgi:hypothetical protein